ncbi:hypothetical protein [Streptomonospora litoralis]|uniref:Uncharacterized protein n=1 Tax=Streptomonospora litoralis TaxID=2498135 RepID=A0A4P6PWL3_9ACTN|nr:hypothetical protein [Streptomonospora litoralis]QBI52568.1 hypothetical protein EKD16_03790 [Streptomonospora litoralis]
MRKSPMIPAFGSAAVALVLMVAGAAGAADDEAAAPEDVALTATGGTARGAEVPSAALQRSWAGGARAPGVTAGSTGDGPLGGTTYFQPVNPILEKFGVNLLTG